MLAKVEDPAHRAELISGAIQRGIMREQQIEEILQWSSHEPTVEALLIATLGERMSTPAIRERIERLAKSEYNRVSLIADLVLIHLDGDQNRIDAMVSHLESDEPRLRLSKLSFIFSTIRLNDLVGTAPLLKAMYERFGRDERIGQDLLGTLLAVAPHDAVDLWREGFAGADSLAPKLRLAYHALSASSELEPSFFEGLSAEDETPILVQILEVARANAGDGPTDEQLLDLVDMRHRTAVLWAIEQTDEMEIERATRILMRVIENELGRGDRRSAVSPVFVEAAARLADRAPERLDTPLRRANESRDTPACESLLAAILREGADIPWEHHGTPDWHNDRLEALASIVAARLDPDSLADPDRLEGLERVALGYGSLPQLFRVQAAWLALKARGEARRAIAQLMSETSDTP